MTFNGSGHLVPLDQMEKADAARGGAKAWNCARLRQAGFRVPDGLVVLATASDAALPAIAGHEWFQGFPDDARFAVRSSGIGEDGDGQSFAGIHETRLNVARRDVAAAVAACRASARSPQAVEYRRARRLPTSDIDIAVLIQEMVQPIASGVAFTVNPVTGADDEIVVNGSWGLGDALVSGQVDPDEFVLAKRDGELRRVRIGEKGDPAHGASWSLSPSQLRSLAAELRAVERLYGTPQDVEWCRDDGGFWIVQARPVTSRRPRHDDIEWTRANVAEVLPDQTSPQALFAFEDLLNRAQAAYLGRLIAPELGPIVKSFQGRLYFNLTQLRRICRLTGVAPAEMLRSMGHPEAIDPADERAASIGPEAIACAPDLLRIAWRHLRARRVMARHEDRTRALLLHLGGADPRKLSDAEVWAGIQPWLDDAPSYLQTVLLLSNVMFHETPLRRMCDRAGFSYEQLVYPQLGAGERSVSAQQAFDLVALAETARGEPLAARFIASGDSDRARMREALAGTAFLAAFDRFMDAYGHRGAFEYDWSLPRYAEDPTPILSALRLRLQAPRESDCSTVVREQGDASDAWAAFEWRLGGWRRWTMLPAVRRSLRRIKQYYVWRERVRSDVARIVAALRVWHLALADRFVARGWLRDRGDYFLLHLGEVAAVTAGRLAPGELAPLAASRQAALDRQRRIRMPLLMREAELPLLVRTAGISGAADGRELRGHPVSGGCVEGEVVVVRDPGDFSRMKPGAILVAPATDPSWTPLFTLASGVIVELGGVLSHAATIAREYGLPAVANVAHATRRLRTGDRVRLDAVEGLVYKLVI